MNEFEIYQNRLIGAHLIWEFSKHYTQVKSVDKEQEFPTILHVMPVLPLCLNMRVVEGIRTRNLREGSIVRALADNKDLFSGLQERMTSMTSLTFKSLLVGHAARLIHFDRESMIIVPNSANLPGKIDKKLYKDYKDSIAACRRVGYWFAKLSVPEISMYFNISL